MGINGLKRPRAIYFMDKQWAEKLLKEITQSLDQIIKQRNKYIRATDYIIPRTKILVEFLESDKEELEMTNEFFDDLLRCRSNYLLDDFDDFYSRKDEADKTENGE